MIACIFSHLGNPDALIKGGGAFLAFVALIVIINKIPEKKNRNSPK